MSHGDPARSTAMHSVPPRSSVASVIPAEKITIFGCAQDEAAVFHDHAARLGIDAVTTEAPVSEHNLELARGSTCISVNHKATVENQVLLTLRQIGVEYVSTRSVGCNHIDVAYASTVGIVVETVAYSPDSVADYTLMLMLMVLRHAKSMVRRIDVHDYRLNEVRGLELRDLVVGVIGTGRIGAAVMQRLHGFGCRVVAHDTCPGSDVEYVSLDDLLRLSDIVTLHTPLNVATRHVLNRTTIEQMKHGAMVINTGRGSLIDTEALLPALTSGRLGGAALDVVEGEEDVFYADLQKTRVKHKSLLQLQGLSNVIISPHTAYYTEHALRDTVESSLINCLNFKRKRAT
jgi:D-specific alpha-keto acid dehydrogenase